MRRWLTAVVIGTVMAGVALGSAALAQTKSAFSGAFDKLSLGNQKVAASLYQAQNAETSFMGSTLKPLTLNQIAAKRQAGQGWGQIFRDMKAQGLVHEKTLRQVVTRYGQFGGLERTTNRSKRNALGAGASGNVDGGSNGNGHGGQ